MAKPDTDHTPTDPKTAAFVASVKRGLASAEAGQTVPYENVRTWLLSWGTDRELPKPECR